jgi:hypothetical protein
LCATLRLNAVKNSFQCFDAKQFLFTAERFQILAGGKRSASKAPPPNAKAIWFCILKGCQNPALASRQDAWLHFLVTGGAPAATIG